MRVVNDSGLRACWFIGRVPPHRLSATFLVKGTFRLRHGRPVETLPEDEQEDPTGDLFRDEDSKRSLLYPSDFALMKPRADATLVGHCHAPGGKPVQVCAVSFAVGSWSKKLAVVGDRQRQRGLVGYSMPEPDPFTSMEISWERAYGGPEVPENPVGRGVEPEQLPDGSKVLPMANVGYVGQLVHDSVRRAKPASFAPIPMAWHERMRKAGTFDAKWLKESWPWFPGDTDWSLFNAAPNDQQLDFLHGDEAVRLENLHPEYPLLETSLPGLRPRLFTVRNGENDSRFLEIPLHLDTLHINADQEKIYLAWRGVSEIRDNEMTDFLDLYVVSEPLREAPGTLEHHQAEHARRIAAPAPPVPGPWPLVEVGPVRQPSTDWVADAEQAAAEVEQAAAAFQGELESRRQALDEVLRPQGLHLPPFEVPSTATEPSPEDLLSLAEKRHALLEQIDPDLARRTPAPTRADFEPPGIEAPKVPEGPAPGPPARRSWTREGCMAHAQARGAFAGENLSGLDLSSLDLHGLDLGGAILKSARLTDSNLSEANLRGAVLAGADLRKANLQSADLEQADLTESNLEGADLRQTRLRTADLSRARMKNVRLMEADSAEALFREADLAGAVLTGGSFPLADFDGACLEETDLAGATLEGASLEGTRAAGAKVAGARLSGIRAARADFTGASFRNAEAPGSVWEGARLEGADFTGACLRLANFARAFLRKAILHRADLRRARFSGAVLEQANVSGANLFRGTLEGAVLDKADFRGSNLYEVEFYESRWQDARFRGANLKGTKLHGKTRDA